MITHTVVLSGGPKMITDEERVQRVSDLGEQVKLNRGNVWDHFTHSGQTVILEGDEVPRFDWCARTKVAE